MSENGQVDRDAILARRAVLVSSTLASLLGAGCSTPTTGPDVVVDSVAVPPPGSAPATSASAAPRQPERRTWASVMAVAPPLSVPAPGALPATEQKQLEEQAASRKLSYEALGRLWDQGPPDCAPDACDARWQEGAKQLNELLMWRGPLCGWGDGQSISYIERENAHRDFLRRQAEGLAEEFAAAAQRLGQKSAWEKLFRGTAMPHPCLSCVAPRPRVLESVLFPAQGSEPTSTSTGLLEGVKQMLAADPALQLKVRGHADPGEAGDRLALSRKRAEAVREWLTKSGVAASRLQVVALGDAVPIHASAGPSGALNMRVDFDR